MTTKAQRDETAALKARAADMLRERLPIGAHVGAIVLHTSRSGMQRSIALIITSTDTEGHAYLWNVSGSVARVTGRRFDDERGGVIVHGVGVDATFEVVYALASALHGDGYALTRDRL